jgi:hypothetical protein
MNESALRNLISHINGMSPMHQRTLDLWEFDYSGNFVGFTYKGKRMMRCIADYLRQLHLAGMYYLDLFDKNFVQLPNFNVYFPYVPLTAPTNNQNATLMWGISNDTSQFRLLVSFLIRSTHPQPVLSIDFRLFFSEIFTNGMNSALILEQVKEYSFYQLYHPITFDSLDRLRFVHLIVQYRNDDKLRFDLDRDLEKQEYELLLWKNSFPPTHFLYKMMRRAIDESFGKRRLGTLHATTIPKFIRNVHHHYTEATSQVSIFNFFNRIIYQLASINTLFCFFI